MLGRNAAMIRRFHPRYRSPKLIYQELLDRSIGAQTAWLDIGCGKRICSDDELDGDLPRRGTITVGCDRDPYLSKHSSIKNLVICDAAALPFRDRTFNLVTAAMVFEHLEDPQAVFREVARISQPGGRFIAFTPNRFNYAMIVASLTPYRFHLLFKKLTHYFARGEWQDFEEEVFPTWYRANSVAALRRLASAGNFREERLDRLALAHSFGFVRPLYALSLLFERCIDRLGLHVLKADILGIFVRQEDGPRAASAPNDDDRQRLLAAGGRR